MMAKSKDKASEDQPFDDLTETEAAPAPIEPMPAGAAARIRAFEDEHFGKDAVRIDGKIERGSGSPFASMSDEDRKKYEALERLVVAEQKLADAHAALIASDAAHEAAEAEANG
jgi:hypothetical protein